MKNAWNRDFSNWPMALRFSLEIIILEVIIKNPRAFDSFLISVAGMRHLMNESVLLPDWTLPQALLRVFSY